MTIKYWNKHEKNYHATVRVYSMRDYRAIKTMDRLIVKAESPNQPIVNLPSIGFGLYMLAIEFGLTISLVCAFVFRLFCL